MVTTNESYTGGHSHQVFLFDALLLSLPVECAVREVDAGRAAGPAALLPRGTPCPGPRGEARELPKQPLILAVYGSHLVVGEGEVLPVSASGTAEDQPLSKLNV